MSQTIHVFFDKLTDDRHSLFDASKHPDVEIKCRSSTFKVHKCILSSHGGFFNLVCKNTAFKEGKTGVITLDNDDPDVVLAVLNFLYGLPYLATSDDQSAATFHAQIYAAAEFYQLPELKETACQNFLKVSMNGATGAQSCLKAVKEVYSAERVPSVSFKPSSGAFGGKARLPPPVV